MERIFQSTPLLLLNPYIFFIYPIDIYTLTEQSIRYSNPNQKYRYLQLGQHAKGVKKTVITSNFSSLYIITQGW